MADGVSLAELLPGSDKLSVCTYLQMASVMRVPVHVLGPTDTQHSVFAHGDDGLLVSEASQVTLWRIWFSRSKKESRKTTIAAPSASHSCSKVAGSRSPSL